MKKTFIVACILALISLIASVFAIEKSYNSKEYVTVYPEQSF